MRTGVLTFMALAGVGLVGLACSPPGITPDGVTTTNGSSGSTSSGSSGSTTDAGDETETGTDTSPTGTGTNFVPDVSTTQPTSCDPFLQDCPEGEKCVPYGSTGGNWDANKCVPILGDQATGEPCIYEGVESALDDCDGTGHCWNVLDVEGELVGTCHAFCTGTPDDPMCPEGSQCLISGDATIILCIPQCDPILQDCDGEDRGCYWTGSDFSCVFTTLDTEPGQPCGFINDCAPAHLCTDASYVPGCQGASCCAPFCDINLGDEQCAAVPGTSCMPFWEEGAEDPNYPDLGICILM